MRTISGSLCIISHAAVHSALSGATVPKWETLRLIVEYLNGDEDRFHQLWTAASAEAKGRNPLTMAIDRLAAITSDLDGYVERRAAELAREAIAAAHDRVTIEIVRMQEQINRRDEVIIELRRRLKARNKRRAPDRPNGDHPDSIGE